MKSTRRSAFNPIDSFWKWFTENSSALAEEAIPNILISELETKLFAIQRFDWEIGPGLRVRHLFALSPRGNPDLLQLAREIIARSPILPDWEFYPAKPPRDWNLAFRMSLDESEVEIDGKQWEFVAYKSDDGTLDLLLKPDEGCKNLSNQYLYWAATIIVDGEIGEEARMERVRDIEVVSSWANRQTLAARRFKPGALSTLLGLKKLNCTRQPSKGVSP